MVDNSHPPDTTRGGQDAGPAQLKRGAIGLVGVVFMVVAFSAPITAMTGNLPVAIGFGNGIGAPGGFIIATVVLAIFSVGFVALAKHITAAGAFYTFVAVVAIALLSHKDISVAAKVLGLVLICEIGMLTITAVGALSSGGPDGIIWSSLGPATALSTNGVAGGVVTANWWRTLVSPIIGGLGMVLVIYLMATNMKAAAGAASGSLFFKAIPWIVVLLFLGSMALALYWRSAKPELYARIGGTVFDDEDDADNSLPDPVAEPV